MNSFVILVLGALVGMNGGRDEELIDSTMFWFIVRKPGSQDIINSLISTVTIATFDIRIATFKSN